MKIVSWNTALKHLLKKINLDLVLIQETKRDLFDIDFIKSLWSSKDVGWVFVEAYGKSGGILTMWDESKILVIEVLKGGYSLSVKCSTIYKKLCWVTNVYRSMDYKERRFIWPKLSSLSAYCTDSWCIGGDFNITRRVRSNFHPTE